jgi:hypothetical protein
MCVDNMERGALPLGHIVGSQDNIKSSKVGKQQLVFFEVGLKEYNLVY